MAWKGAKGRSAALEGRGRVWEGRGRVAGGVWRMRGRGSTEAQKFARGVERMEQRRSRVRGALMLCGNSVGPAWKLCLCCVRAESVLF